MKKKVVLAGAVVGQRMSENAYPGYDQGVAYRQVCRTVPGIRHVRERTEYRITYRMRSPVAVHSDPDCKRSAYKIV